jgi:hypothetical protein
VLHRADNQIGDLADRRISHREFRQCLVDDALDVEHLGCRPIIGVEGYFRTCASPLECESQLSILPDAP